jgi:hypothetical protein
MFGLSQRVLISCIRLIAAFFGGVSEPGLCECNTEDRRAALVRPSGCERKGAAHKDAAAHIPKASPGSGQT